MSFLDFGLGLSPPWEGSVEAFVLVLGAILIFFAVVAPLKRSRIACQKPNIVRGWARARARKKPSTKKEKGPPGVSNDKGVYLSDPRDPPPVVKLKGGAGLCPVHELEALNLDSSDDSESSGDEVLNTDEEAELDEEAAKYEKERYHPDDHIQNSKKPRRRQFQTALSQVVPSAPPPYETRPKSYSFLSEKVKRKLRLAFPVFEGIEGKKKKKLTLDVEQLDILWQMAQLGCEQKLPGLCVTSIQYENFTKAANLSKSLSQFMLQNWTSDFEQTLRELRAAIIQINSTCLDLSLTEGLSSWITSAVSYFKEWVGVGLFSAAVCCGLVLLLWLVCRLRAQTKRDKVVIAQALVALEQGASIDIWLTMLKQ
ncbi:uncharacterized protein LOC118238466 [Cricetulus griseus]|uniref:Uncharacterized protein LOC118238466 n=1 Tax=Cricetulus griseus TaxID=10029 RepID=A0A9J7GUV9_CRIGR|nr:uncharacterized protein LOC118238466 [Cricetulus griseus]